MPPSPLNLIKALKSSSKMALLSQRLDDLMEATLATRRN